MKVGQKKSFWLITAVMLLAFLISVPVSASSINEAAAETDLPVQQSVLKETEEEQQKVIDYGMSLFNWEEIEALEGELVASTPYLEGFSLKEEVTALVKGEKELSIEEVLNSIGSMFFGEIGLFIRLGARFVLIVLMCNILQLLSSSFKSKETVKVAFFVCYLAIIYSVIQSFMVMVELAESTINGLSQMMMVCVPTLLAFMTTTGYAGSAAAMAPVIITALTLSCCIIRLVVLPCIISIILLEIMSAMSEEYKMDQFIKLFYKGVKWALNGLLGLSVGILGIYRLTLPYADLTVKKAAVKFSSAFIPVVGSAAGGAVDFITGCAGLIKNTFSAGVILWIILLVSLPLIKIFAYVVVYHVAGAVIEPLGNKKMAKIAEKLGKGCEFILSTVGIVALLCLCSLMICMSIGMS